MTSRKITRRLLTMLLIVLLAGLVVFVQRWLPSTAGGPAMAAALRALPVHVVAVQAARSYQRQRDFTGLVVASRASDIGFELGGKLIAVNVEEGQRVHGGEAIATLDTRQLRVELERAQSQLEEATARLQLLREGPRDETIAAARAELRSRQSNHQLQSKNLARRQGLSRSQAISAEEVDRSRYDSQASAAQVIDHCDWIAD